MKRLGVFAVVVAALTVGSAPNVFAADVWTPSLVPSNIQVVEGGGFIVYFDSQVSATCTNRVHIYANQHSVTDSGAKAMLAAAMTALATDKKIAVMYDDSTAYCWGRYLTIDR